MTFIPDDTEEEVIELRITQEMLLIQILNELKKINLQLSIMTGDCVIDSDIE